ncbi:hypothetical protein HDU86_005062 [Geranomyces michiganensis]|nr:hypothetical protein HDU86_005062 [Geranomyces michiganensis]
MKPSKNHHSADAFVDCDSDRETILAGMSEEEIYSLVSNLDMELEDHGLGQTDEPTSDDDPVDAYGRPLLIYETEQRAHELNDAETSGQDERGDGGGIHHPQRALPENQSVTSHDDSDSSSNGSDALDVDSQDDEDAHIDGETKESRSHFDGRQRNTEQARVDEPRVEAEEVAVPAAVAENGGKGETISSEEAIDTQRNERIAGLAALSDDSNQAHLDEVKAEAAEAAVPDSETSFLQETTDVQYESDSLSPRETMPTVADSDLPKIPMPPEPPQLGLDAGPYVRPSAAKDETVLGVSTAALPASFENPLPPRDEVQKPDIKFFSQPFTFGATNPVVQSAAPQNQGHSAPGAASRFEFKMPSTFSFDKTTSQPFSFKAVPAFNVSSGRAPPDNLAFGTKSSQHQYSTPFVFKFPSSTPGHGNLREPQPPAFESFPRKLSERVVPAPGEHVDNSITVQPEAESAPDLPALHDLTTEMASGSIPEAIEAPNSQFMLEENQSRQQGVSGDASDENSDSDVDSAEALDDEAERGPLSGEAGTEEDGQGSTNSQPQGVSGEDEDSDSEMDSAEVSDDEAERGPLSREAGTEEDGQGSTDSEAHSEHEENVGDPHLNDAPAKSNVAEGHVGPSSKREMAHGEDIAAGGQAVDCSAENSDSEVESVEESDDEAKREFISEEAGTEEHGHGSVESESDYEYEENVGDPHLDDPSAKSDVAEGLVGLSPKREMTYDGDSAAPGQAADKALKAKVGSGEDDVEESSESESAAESAQSLASTPKAKVGSGEDAVEESSESESAAESAQSLADTQEVVNLVPSSASSNLHQAESDTSPQIALSAAEEVEGGNLSTDGDFSSESSESGSDEDLHGPAVQASAKEPETALGDGSHTGSGGPHPPSSVSALDAGQMDRDIRNVTALEEDAERSLGSEQHWAILEDEQKPRPTFSARENDAPEIEGENSPPTGAYEMEAPAALDDGSRDLQNDSFAAQATPVLRAEEIQEDEMDDDGDEGVESDLEGNELCVRTPTPLPHITVPVQPTTRAARPSLPCILTTRPTTVVESPPSDPEELFSECEEEGPTDRSRSRSPPRATVFVAERSPMTPRSPLQKLEHVLRSPFVRAGILSDSSGDDDDDDNGRHYSDAEQGDDPDDPQTLSQLLPRAPSPVPALTLPLPYAPTHSRRPSEKLSVSTTGFFINESLLPPSPPPTAPLSKLQRLESALMSPINTLLHRESRGHSRRASDHGLGTMVDSRGRRLVDIPRSRSTVGQLIHYFSTLSAGEDYEERGIYHEDESTSKDVAAHPFTQTHENDGALLAAEHGHDVIKHAELVQSPLDESAIQLPLPADACTSGDLWKTPERQAETPAESPTKIVKPSSPIAEEETVANDLAPAAATHAPQTSCVENATPVPESPELDCESDATHGLLADAPQVATELASEAETALLGATPVPVTVSLEACRGNLALPKPYAADESAAVTGGNIPAESLDAPASPASPAEPLVATVTTLSGETAASAGPELASEPAATAARALQAESAANAAPASQVEPATTAGPEISSEPAATAAPVLDVDSAATTAPATQAKPATAAGPELSSEPAATAAPALEVDSAATTAPASQAEPAATTAPASQPEPAAATASASQAVSVTSAGPEHSSELAAITAPASQAEPPTSAGPELPNGPAATATTALPAEPSAATDPALSHAPDAAAVPAPAASATPMSLTAHMAPAAVTTVGDAKAMSAQSVKPAPAPAVASHQRALSSHAWPVQAPVAPSDTLPKSIPGHESVSAPNPCACLPHLRLRNAELRSELHHARLTLQAALAAAAERAPPTWRAEVACAAAEAEAARAGRAMWDEAIDAERDRLRARRRGDRFVY